jgi:hypothetical protein
MADNHGRLALYALGQSVLINMVAPGVVYRLVQGHHPHAGLMALAASGLPPALWLGWTWWRKRAVDFLGLFSAENVVIAMIALLLAHSEREALVGRSLQNVILAGLFLLTLTVGRPMLFHMTRQLTTGNDPTRRADFNAQASNPHAMAAYRTLTWGWIAALLIKACGAYVLGANLPTSQYLIASPLWDLVSDSALVTWSILYGRARLTPQTSEIPA